MVEPIAAVMYNEMISHECITDDQMVQKTTFSSGAEVIVNFDEIEREGMPSKGYKVSGMEGNIKRGYLTTELHMKTG